MHKCPKCGETELFQFTYDYSKAHRPVVNILCNNCGKQFPPISKLPKETPKQKTTLEEAAEKYSEGNDLEYAYVQEIPAFIAGAKWQQERMYSEEEVKLMLSESFKASQEGYDISADNIIEQFKNK